MPPSCQHRAILLIPAGQPSAFFFSCLREVRSAGQSCSGQHHRHHCFPRHWLCRRVWEHVHAQEGPFHSKSPGMRQPGKTWNISSWQRLQLLRSNQYWVITQFVQDTKPVIPEHPCPGSLCHLLQAPSSSQWDSVTGFSRSTHFIKDLWKTLTPVTGNK